MLGCTDSTHSIDLGNGDTVWDIDRPDRSPPPMRPFTPGPGRPPVDDVDGERAKRGDTLTTAKAQLGIPESIEPRTLSPVLQVLVHGGIRLHIADGVVASLAYLPEFTKKICGVWIGASPDDVIAALGQPIAENSLGPNSTRGWTFRHRDDGSHISVTFDEEDRVETIGR